MMYYFGTNLDKRFSMGNFWPKPEESNRMVYDRKELEEEFRFIVARQRKYLEMKAAAEQRASGGSSQASASQASTPAAVTGKDERPGSDPRNGGAV